MTMTYHHNRTRVRAIYTDIPIQRREGDNVDREVIFFSNIREKQIYRETEAQKLQYCG